MVAYGARSAAFARCLTSYDATGISATWKGLKMANILEELYRYFKTTDCLSRQEAL